MLEEGDVVVATQLDRICRSMQEVLELIGKLMEKGRHKKY